ncbi:hypothetical protein IIC65_08900 [Candidatus Sumerlaeota bacterium]|nr:hypothetical protein [Candidatus Sumerlaeota bacterium]
MGKLSAKEIVAKVHELKQQSDEKDQVIGEQMHQIQELEHKSGEKDCAIEGHLNRIEELEKEGKEKDEAVGEQMRQIQDLEAKLKGLMDEAVRLGESAAGADELYDALSKELD